MAGWRNDLDTLKYEVIQREDDGCEIPDDLRECINAIPKSEAWNKSLIDPLYDALMALPEDQALAKQEPNELQAIRELRPSGPRDLNWQPDETMLHDRMHGAWSGRSLGCALGKPVELLAMSQEDGLCVGREKLKAYLSKRDAFPLTDYIPGYDAGDGVKLMCPLSTLEQISFMESDDDIHYSMVGLGVLENYGPDFQWYDVARYWLNHIPIGAICTAELQAIITFQNHAIRETEGPCAATAELTRMYRNPYREWIGAQIRADGWAWACAGKPELAAEYAYRDACWTHVRNGIYGEMFVAAMIAAAFVVSDPKELVEIGLSEIPSECRLAKAVRECLSWIEDSADFETCMVKLEAKYKTMNPVHTINNALIVVLSLFYGEGEIEPSTCIAVMCALDTDCNGATVGSIVGAQLGPKAFKGEMISKLNDTIKPRMLGFTEVKMRELAKRHVKVWHEVQAYAKGRS